jgi:hypothetical protein
MKANRKIEENQESECNSESSCYTLTDHQNPQDVKNVNRVQDRNCVNKIDNGELALQFTNLLNNSEKMNFENNELKLKNKELLSKIDLQDKAIRELATLLHSIGKINLSLADLQNWLSTESSKRKSLIPNLLELNQVEQPKQQQQQQPQQHQLVRFYMNPIIILS